MYKKPDGQIKQLLFFVAQANETFAFVGNVTHYTRVWLNISAQLRTFLEEERLQNYLVWLQQVAVHAYLFLALFMTLELTKYNVMQVMFYSCSLLSPSSCPLSFSNTLNC